MRVIATNRNEKDFQSVIFDTDLTWDELINNTINKTKFYEHVKNSTMNGIGVYYPRALEQEVLINDSRHFSIKYTDFKNEPLKNYWVINELFKVED